MQQMLVGAPDESPGQSADDYEILYELGRGGRGTVYLAREKQLGREVAIKFLSAPIKDSEGQRRFDSEVKTIASLDHPNIVVIYARGEMNGRPFFTMKHVAGESLAEHLEAYAAPESAADLMIKVSRAVHHAHKRGVLHRDLKPSNILLDKSGEPFVSDFGLAKRTDEESQTLTGVVLGTPAYMSPEQARGESLTAASDVFSLGTILYHMLCGRPAFEGNTSHLVLQKVIESDASFGDLSLSQLPRDLVTICRKCLSKVPAERYATADELADDLARWRKGEPVLARNLSLFKRAGRWAMRHPWPLATTALTLLAVTLLVDLKSPFKALQGLFVKEPYAQTAYLKASNTSTELGFTVPFIHGDTLLVGAEEESTGFPSSGAVYVFARDDAGWQPQTMLKASNMRKNGNFGRSVNMSGDTIAIGAYSDSVQKAGAVSIFVRDGESWKEQATLGAASPRREDFFGAAIGLDGDRLVAGARREQSNGSSQDDDSFDQAGAAYVFRRDGTAWTQEAYLKAPEPWNDDRFGGSVAISGDTVLANARYKSDSSGAVHVFRLNGEHWEHETVLRASNASAGDQFGWAVAILGETIAISAAYEDGVDDLQTDSGAVYMFQRTDNGWHEEAILRAEQPGIGDGFGNYLALSEDQLVVAAPREDGNGDSQANDDLEDSGAAYVFEKGDHVWTQTAYLKASNAGVGDEFGDKLSVSGKTVLVTAKNEDGDASGEDQDYVRDSGAAYVFDPVQP